jgi:hypothetical protein
MLFISWDPGKTTGVVVAVTEPDDLELSRYPMTLLPGKLNLVGVTECTCFECIEAVINAYGNLADVFIVENYFVYPHKTEAHALKELPASEMIGVLQWEAWLREIPFVRQSASQAKKRWPNRRFERHHIDLKQIPTHARDALRHLMTYYELQFGNVFARGPHRE